jgi:hypothetical protein
MASRDHPPQVDPAQFDPAQFDLKAVLRDIFAADGTVTVASLWDRGWTVQIGDNLHGVRAVRTFSNEELDFDVLAAWLGRTFADLHPTSDFARKYSGRGLRLAWAGQPPEADRETRAL